MNIVKRVYEIYFSPRNSKFPVFMWWKHLWMCSSENWPNWPKSYMYGSQDVLYKYCGNGKYKSNLAMCSEPLFLESLCSQYPFQFTRTVRLRKNITFLFTPRNWTERFLSGYDTSINYVVMQGWGAVNQTTYSSASVI